MELPMDCWEDEVNYVIRQRGMNYRRFKHIKNFQKVDENHVTATVANAEGFEYAVTLVVDEEFDSYDLTCTCPFAADNTKICKHEVAVLLEYLGEPVEPIPIYPKPKLTQKQLRRAISKEPEVAKIRHFLRRGRRYYETKIDADIAVATVDGKISFANSFIATKTALQLLDDCFQMDGYRRQLETTFKMIVLDKMLAAKKLTSEETSIDDVIMLAIESFRHSVNNYCSERMPGKRVLAYLCELMSSHAELRPDCMDILCHFVMLDDAAVSLLSGYLDQMEVTERELWQKKYGKATPFVPSKFILELREELFKKHFPTVDEYCEFLRGFVKYDADYQYRIINKLIENDLIDRAKAELAAVIAALPTETTTERIEQVKVAIADKEGDKEGELNAAMALFNMCTPNLVDYIEQLLHLLPDKYWDEVFLAKTIPAFTAAHTKDLNRIFQSSDKVDDLLMFVELYGGGTELLDMVFRQAIMRCSNDFIKIYLHALGDLMGDKKERKYHDWQLGLKRIKAVAEADYFAQFEQRMLRKYPRDQEIKQAFRDCD